MKLLTRLTFLLLLLLPLAATADIPKGMKADFAPAGGYIIMPIGDEFLVDLDASANLQEGDILTLVMPGERVVHPVTKEILGTLEIPMGYLQVTRIKSGYSYAKLLYSETAPEKGNQVKRFEQVPTRYTAEPANPELYQTLKNDLPQLDWLDPGASKQPLIIFELKNNLLTVKNSNGSTLKSYQLVDGVLVAPKAVAAKNHIGFSVEADPAKNKGFLNKTANKLLDSVGLGTQNDLPIGAGIIRNQENLKSQGIWMSPNLSGDPAGLVTADLDNDGIIETAVAMQNEILITKITDGTLSEEAKIELPVGIRPLSLDAIDLDGNGIPELYLSAAKDQDISSQAFEFNGSEYQLIINDIPWFLRVAELPEEGRQLIAQRPGDKNQPFFRAPFRVSRNGNELQEGAELSLPPHVTLFSFLPFPGEANGQLFAYLTQTDYLKVVSANEQEFWESGDYFGGTETSYYNTIDPDGDLIEPVYIQQRILRGPSGEILVGQNDGLRTLKRFRMFKNSRVIALNWNGFAMQESWRTAGQNGYLADFALGDADNDGKDELTMVVKYKHKSLIQEARSAILIYELN